MKVELDIFSGRPNPFWELTAAEEEEFRRRLRSLPRDSSPRAPESKDGLGYRGLIVSSAGGSVESFDRLVVSNGAVFGQSPRGPVTFLDQDQAVERWLLETGKDQLDADLYDEARMALRPEKPPIQERTQVKIEDVLQRHEQQLMAIPGVTGVGIAESNGQPVILIMVKQLTADLKKKLPNQLEGFGVKVEVSGEIRAF